MYRIIMADLDKLEKELNQVVTANPEFNCQIIDYGGPNDGQNRITFLLTPVNPDDKLHAIGEYKVVRFVPRGDNHFGIPDLESAMNAFDSKEGWTLDCLSPTYPLAIFRRDVQSKLARSDFGSTDELREFERIGAPTMEVYKWHKEKIATFLAKMEDIQHDAGEHYEQKRFGDYVRLAYLAVEKAVEAVFAVSFQTKDFAGNKFSDAIYRVGSKYGIQLLDVGTLWKWQGVRNQFVHENQKVSPAQAEEAQAFFSPTLQQLKALLKSLPFNGTLGIALDGFAPGGKNRDLERLLDEDVEGESGDDGCGPADAIRGGRSPNDDRSDSLNPNSAACRAARNNRSNQLNPNNPRYQGGKSKK